MLVDISKSTGKDDKTPTLFIACNYDTLLQSYILLVVLIQIKAYKVGTSFSYIDKREIYLMNIITDEQ